MRKATVKRSQHEISVGKLQQYDLFEKHGRHGLDKFRQKPWYLRPEAKGVLRGETE